MKSISKFHPNLKLHSVWLHKNGKEYVVLGFANTRAGMDPNEYPLMVVYTEYPTMDNVLEDLLAKSPAEFVRSRTFRRHLTALGAALGAAPERAK